MYLNELNEQQRAAVETLDGPVLVVAGAGSGKTRVITTRIVHLVSKGISPYQILAMTFTNKAAMEMKHRIGVSLAKNMRDLTVTTFHSFCARFLRREIGYLDRDPNFAIYDTQDQTTCLKRVIREMDLPDKNYPAAHFRNKISFLKNQGDPKAEPETEPEKTIFRNYQKQLFDQNALDFDDLLVLTCQILATYSDCRDRYRRRFQYILVDEYQDTNKIQARLIHLLLNEDANLCVVGDEDQSIYGWRGADIQNILDFELHFPQARVFKLEQNYRSSQRILDYANEIIAENLLRKPKKLWTASGPGEPISIRDEYSGATEAETLVQLIVENSRNKKLDYGEFAVLFRSNYLSRNLEEMFRRYQIPYQLIGGLKFYDRKEIKDLLAYMRIVVNNRDWTSFSRAIGVPSRGIGAKSLDKLFRLFQDGYHIGDMLEQAIKTRLLGARGTRGLAEFNALYQRMVETRDEIKPRQWLTDVIKALDYEQYLEKQDIATVENRVANVEELLESMAELEAQGIETLSQFMDFSALVSDQDEIQDDQPKVSLMTVHAAKGLEFHTVFVIGLEDGVFPNQRTLTENPNALEEERRLFYVAVTRAKYKLYLSYARKRQTFGSTTSNPKSRFLLAPGSASNPGFDDDDPFLSGQKKNKKVKIADLESQVQKMKNQLRARNVEVDFGSLQKGLKAGDVVKHPKFGQGTVTATRGRGDLQTVTVYFPGKGKKTLVAKMARLEKVYG